MVHSTPVARQSSITVSSPCIRLCAIDGATGLCRGCGRTLDEIAAWGGLSETARLAIIAHLPERRARAGHTPRDGGVQGSGSRGSE
ncbi:DUF1289 domain-containing protein [Pseudoxanthobacter soli]|uniref:DUF1289 domain-containing protein n=1 Tax=Pseudoxanthobacter soli TaxID=433840 RepID=UPI0009374ED1|nr:DUF1289 domain-containing protein [Pseudoxanthobacter soli]